MRWSVKRKSEQTYFILNRPEGQSGNTFLLACFHLPHSSSAPRVSHSSLTIKLNTPWLLFLAGSAPRRPAPQVRAEQGGRCPGGRPGTGSAAQAPPGRCPWCCRQPRCGSDGIYHLLPSRLRAVSPLLGCYQWPAVFKSSKSSSVLRRFQSTSVAVLAQDVKPYCLRSSAFLWGECSLAVSVNPPTQRPADCFTSSHHLLTCTEDMFLCGNKTSANINNWKNWNLEVLRWIIWSYAGPIYVHPIFSYRNASAHSSAVGMLFTFNYREEWLWEYTVMARRSTTKKCGLTFPTTVLSILVTYSYLKRQTSCMFSCKIIWLFLSR